MTWKTSDSSPPLHPSLEGRRASTAPVTDNGNSEQPVHNTPALGFDPQHYEDPEDYRQGGHHPVEIGHVLNDRYEVVNKLGDGGYGLVWLCYDRETKFWRAVKILKARDSSSDCDELRFWDALKGEPGHPAFIPPLEHFWVQGPNGRHLCFVLKLLGPHLQQVTKERDLKWMKQQFLNAAHALRYLHSRGLCHGDFTIANILHKMEGFDFKTREDMLDTIGPAKTDSIKSITTQEPRPGQPRYLVRKLSSSIFDEFIVPGDVVVVDFGAAFRVSTPPEYATIPMFHRAPELFLGERSSPASDVWALASNMMVLYGAYYFGEKDSAPAGDRDTILEEMERCLGPLPPKFRTTYNRIHGISDEGVPVIGNDHLFCLGNRDGKEVQEWWRSEAMRTRRNNPFAGRLAESVGGYYMEDRELEGFTDLLWNMFSMDPDRRFTITDVLTHEWLTPTRRQTRPPMMRLPVSLPESSPFLSEPPSAEPSSQFSQQQQQQLSKTGSFRALDFAPSPPLFKPGATQEEYVSNMPLIQDMAWSDTDTAVLPPPSRANLDRLQLPIHNGVYMTSPERPMFDRRDLCLFITGVAFATSLVAAFLLGAYMFGPGRQFPDAATWKMTVHLVHPPAATSPSGTTLLDL